MISIILKYKFKYTTLVSYLKKILVVVDFNDWIKKVLRAGPIENFVDNDDNEVSG